MGVIKVPTNFNIELEFEIPDFARRLVALIIDMIIEFIYLRFIIVIYSDMVSSSRYLDDDQRYDVDAIGMVLFLPIMVYHVFFEITMNGQSLGKKIMGLRVVDEKGGKASISQFLIRWLLRVSDLWIVAILLFLLSEPQFDSVLTVFIVLFGLGFLITDIVLVVSSKKAQRIGDILAHTILIRINTKSDIRETVFQEVADTYKPSFPEIMKLSDRDINAIKSILEAAKKKSDFNMAVNAGDKIKSHLKIQSSMDPIEFLEVLLMDYNYLSTK